MQNYSLAKRAGIKYFQPEGQQERKCWAPPAVYQSVPVSSETGIRNIYVRNSIGGGEVACRKRLRQPCAQHHRPDADFDFSRNRRRDIQSSSAIVAPVIIALYFILPSDCIGHASAKMAKVGLQIALCTNLAYLGHAH